MILLLIIGFAASVLLTAMSLSLRSFTTPQLRYWARQGDADAKALYPLKARGSAVLLTIELFRALAISGTLVTLAYSMWGGLAWLTGATVLFAVFVVLSELYLKPLGTRLLVWSGSWLLALAQFLKPVTLTLGRVLDRFIAKQPVIMTRSELMHTIGALSPADTDLSADELRIIKHSMAFGEKSVHDIMTPRSVIVSIKEDDVLSPVLLDELHKSGHSRFPVLAANEDHAAGILYTKDLHDLKRHGLAGELMHRPVHYVNENRELDHVLQAFIKTKQHMFMVVNEFAEITGLVTIEDVMEQILGKPIIDEFDRYDSMRDVAAARAKIVRKQIKMVE
ncbi:MAG: CBS domain-containing protein [Candidatus Saccharimonadales bacterium]